MYALFDQFEIEMTLADACSAAHRGRCDVDVALLTAERKIARQLDKIGPGRIREELRGYGAWDSTELADDAANRHRIVWCAANNIREDAA